MSMNDDIKTVLVSEEQLKAKVAELGARISKDYEGKNLVLVSILKGSVVFMADLMRAVTIPCNIDFMVVSSYGGSNTVTGQDLHHPRQAQPPQGRHPARLRGLPGAGRVRGGLWPGLRRKVPQPALCGRAQARDLHEVSPGSNSP